jgi:glycosyltransferase involved in cell wall biosynthesis
MAQALFIHQNFPGQYRHIAPVIAQRRGARVIGLGERENIQLPGVQHLRYPAPAGAGEKTHRYLRPIEGAIRRGQAAAQACISMKRQGFSPEIICCHPGWGEGLFLRDVFPDARILMYCEFYYRAAGADVGFDPAQEVTIDEQARVRTLNLTQLLSLEQTDWGVSPTTWQATRYTELLHDRISVVHDGVDTAGFATPDGPAAFALPDGRTLTREDEVITFVSRNLEPYRGFDVFMRALPGILARRPKAQVVLVGGEERGYGRVPKEGGSWKQVMLKEMEGQIDLARLHFTGRVPHDQLIQLFRISAAHVYFSYPFVLSWSMIEAMSCGALIVGSATPPVQEVIRHGENGLLVQFFAPGELADTVVACLAAPDRYRPLREAARRTAIERYDLHTVCLPQQIKLFDAILEGKPGSVAIPPLAA